MIPAIFAPNSAYNDPRIPAPENHIKRGQKMATAIPLNEIDQYDEKPTMIVIKIYKSEI